MGMIGLSNVERQTLTNQTIIMGFLYGVFLDRVSERNHESYQGLYSCYQATKDMLDFDARLKSYYSTEETNECKRPDS